LKTYETAFRGRRLGDQTRPIYRARDAVGENRHKKRRIPRHFPGSRGKVSEDLECVVVEAVYREPVSAPVIACYKENNRQFS
jgi:hypothetical protein